MTFKQIVRNILLWRLFITAIALGAIAFFPFKPTFPYAEEVLKPLGDRWLTTWAHFDGVHYLTIIKHGYTSHGLIQAFFPVYPYMVKFYTFGQLNPILVGILISTLCFIFGMYYALHLVKMDKGKKVAQRFFWLLLLFPTSFFFSSLYTEGLFFLLVVGSFYAMRKKLWLLAGVLAAVASGTRVVGIFLLPALALEYWESHKDQKNWWFKPEILVLALPLLGLGLYMLYLEKTFGNGLMFYSVQNQFGAQRETQRIILLYQDFYRYLRMLVSIPWSQVLFYRIWLEFLTGFFGTILAGTAFFKVRSSYALFAALAFLTPTLTGTFSSLPRYVLPLFPLFMVAAESMSERIYKITLSIFVIMLVVNLILFTQGLWVA